jgi:hypothetical protein
MNREDIICLAIEHTIHGLKFDEDGLVRFANLVAQHTLANIDPSKFISFQEGVEAGRLAEREACAKLCEDAPEPDGLDLAERIRARGQE